MVYHMSEMFAGSRTLCGVWGWRNGPTSLARRQADGYVMVPLKIIEISGAPSLLCAECQTRYLKWRDKK